MPQIGATSAKIYVETLFEDTNGSVPVHCYIGDADAMTQAKAHQAKRQAAGVNTMLPSHDRTFDGQGAEVPYRAGGRLVERITALLSDTQTQALVVVLQDDELLLRGRPMLHVTSVTCVNESLRSFRDHDKSLPKARIDALFRLIEDGMDRQS